MSSSVSSGRVAFATLVTSQSYVPGALTLAYALKDGATRANVVVLVTPNISEAARSTLAAAFDSIIDVSEIRTRDSHNLLLLGRPDLFNTLTKIHVWALTEFEKIVFLDADTLPLINVDELFDYEELSAAPDCGWPDIVRHYFITITFENRNIYFFSIISIIYFGIPSNSFSSVNEKSSLLLTLYQYCKISLFFFFFTLV